MQKVSKDDRDKIAKKKREKESGKRDEVLHNHVSAKRFKI